MWRNIAQGRPCLSRLVNGVKNTNPLRPVISSHHSHSKHPVPIRCSTITTSTMPVSQVTRVVVQPPSCLHDESVSLSVDGLAPGEEVTLEASMTDTRGVLFMSLAHYRADSNGQVDVSTMESLGGSYRGVFSMGLLSSLSPALKKHKFTRFFKRDVENPNIVTISVFRGHLSNEELVGEGRSEPLSTATHLRHYVAPGVQRIPVRYGKVRGCLFLPPGDGPFPGVVDMFGSAGGLLEYRSAQLASRGIASLALAYFAYDDLPKSLEEFNMSYFEEAVEFLLKHDKVEKPNVGVIGVSKGGDLALSMSTFIPEVTAGVCINGSISNIQSRLNLHNGSIPPLNFDIGKIEMVDGVMDCYESVDDPKEYPETIIPIERADANFLFLVSCDDRNWKSEMFADLAVERLRLAGKTNYTVNKYPGAGHLLEPPYSTFCWASYHKLIRAGMLLGGSIRPHADAQVHAWDALLTFICKHLKNQTVFKGKL
ncbi:acyl-coenzyme A thioesterase 1-like isoform X3 [Portunus trituberculatus]|uniref:acyl-coenzyme A thioesterase 1-like isoform X3 n=1 Tax=Portunus trituberculatus TaxID=210409 RepID=UPI001E1CC7D8|nr:acyl-coenzyme A thioesterase 1-like isoform X3 [Portunus trituberculatus]XP_045112619.1 acyl-coenzyme A thioesterase 1-like isoform X3 [Portunus trituberculatus]XP_045112620.1 acyl-coenzyme A thioesterase 1-like isoform X3 [Portunus trituberculatus]